MIIVKHYYGGNRNSKEKIAEAYRICEYFGDKSRVSSGWELYPVPGSGEPDRPIRLGSGAGRYWYCIRFHNEEDFLVAKIKFGI